MRGQDLRHCASECLDTSGEGGGPEWEELADRLDARSGGRPGIGRCQIAKRQVDPRLDCLDQQSQDGELPALEQRPDLSKHGGRRVRVTQRQVRASQAEGGDHQQRRLVFVRSEGADTVCGQGERRGQLVPVTQQVGYRRRQRADAARGRLVQIGRPRQGGLPGGQGLPALAEDRQDADLLAGGDQGGEHLAACPPRSLPLVKPAHGLPRLTLRQRGGPETETRHHDRQITPAGDPPSPARQTAGRAPTMREGPRWP